MPRTAEQPRPCGSGCGEWAPADVVVALWSDVIYVPTVPVRWWRDDARGVDCPACKQAMKAIAHDGWRVYRCGLHGAWLEPGVRDRIERHFAAEIALHRHVREVTAAIKRGDEATIADLVRRLIAVEQRLGRS